MTATSTHPKLGRLSLAIDGPVARIALRNPPLNVIDIAMMEELSVALEEIDNGGDRNGRRRVGDCTEWRGQGVFGGCGRSRSLTRPSRRDVAEVSRRHPSAGSHEEGYDRRRAWVLSGRRCRTGDDVRHGLHHGIRTVGLP